MDSAFLDPSCACAKKKTPTDGTHGRGSRARVSKHVHPRIPTLTLPPPMFSQAQHRLQQRCAAGAHARTQAGRQTRIRARHIPSLSLSLSLPPARTRTHTDPVVQPGNICSSNSTSLLLAVITQADCRSVDKRNNPRPPLPPQPPSTRLTQRRGKSFTAFLYKGITHPMLLSACSSSSVWRMF